MTRTVLLVEDEDQVLRLIVKVLEMRGYSVLKAESSEKAMILSEAHQGMIDLLIADLELDEAMTGHQLAMNLRRTRPRMRVLYTSGYPLDCCSDHGGEGIQKEVQELMAAFMPKPFTLSALTENVQRAMDGLPA